MSDDSRARLVSGRAPRTRARAVAAAWGVCYVLALRAQSAPDPGGARPQPSGIVTGRVSDARSDAAIPGVEVSLSGVPATRTDTGGRFRLRGAAPGPHVLRVRRIGYVSDSTEVDVARDSVVIEFALLAHATQLEAVRVSEVRTELRLAEFERRRSAKSGGYFVSGADLLKSADRRLSEVVGTAVPAVQVVRTQDGGEFLASRRGPTSVRPGSGGVCAVRVFLNGQALSDSTLNGVTPGELAGAEYHDPTTTPPQYRRTGTQCGVLLLWSR